MGTNTGRGFLAIAILASALTVAPGVLAATSRVFISSVTSQGDLGGLAGADATCNALAAAEGLGGVWVAWLSTSTVDAKDRLAPGSGPFVRVGGTPVVIADDIADLTDGSLDNPVLLDETGLGGPVFVHTGNPGHGPEQRQPLPGLDLPRRR